MREDKERAMHLTRKIMLAAVAAFATLSALGVAGALAAPPGLIGFKYQVKNMPAGSELRVSYGTSVTRTSEGTAQAHNGAISGVEFLNNEVLLFASRPGALDASVVQLLFVDEASVTGDALVPHGASVTLTNLRTQQRIDLHDGRFSIPSGVKPSSPARTGSPRRIADDSQSAVAFGR
jgi:hypothetical protein